MKKLRLLLTKKCNRNCKGCCNKDWDLDALPICKNYSGYDEILLTGGEAMLYPQVILDTISAIRTQNKKAKIYLYTARVEVLDNWKVMFALDGVTLTLHEQTDANDFKFFNQMTIYFANKALRLNVFTGIKMKKINLKFWKVKKNMKWIKKCPLPKDEVFMRLQINKEV